MVENRRNEIYTERLLLRPFDTEDFDVYVKIMGDSEVGKWFPKGDGYSREESKKDFHNVLEHWRKRGFGIWAIINKKEQMLIGRCGLSFITRTSEVEIDFVLSRSYWGRGYATEAATAALEYGFEVLRLDRIIALTKPENIASRRVIEKIGMYYKKNAEYWGITCAYYDISKADYLKKRNMKKDEPK